MKEFSLDISAMFKHGLRQRVKDRRNSIGLVDLVNYEPTEDGLMPYNPVLPFMTQELLYTYGIGFEYPFPQMFVASNKIFLCTATKIYLVDPNSMTSLYELDVYDYDTSVQTTIPEGNYWHLVDLNEAWYLTNGACIVFFPGRGQILGNDESVWISKTKSVTCGSHYKGRTVLGGLDYQNFWDSTWQSFWTTWQTKVKDTGMDFGRLRQLGDTAMPVGKNWVWWSTIGGGDLQALLNNTVATGGYVSSSYGTDDPAFFRQLKRNEMGFYQLPTIGEVLVLKELGEYLIAYSSTGVIALRHVSLEFGSTLAPVHIPKLAQVGLTGRLAIAGDKDHHVFLDNSGTLWRLTADLQAVPLGYKEYLYHLLGAEPTVHYSPNPHDHTGFGEFYITAINHYYKLTQSGLCKTTQALTSAQFFQGGTIGVAATVPDPTEGSFKTDTLDFNYKGNKTIESVHVFTNETRIVEQIKIWIAFDYRKYKQDTWTEGNWYLCTPEGIAYPKVTSEEFRLRFKTNDFRRQDLDGITINYKTPDRRHQRSISVDEVRT